MMRAKLLFFVYCLIGALAAQAQPQLTVRTFNIRDGLAANFLSGMGQTSDGLLWASTWNGLCCYDGYRFMTFRGERKPGEALATNRIIRLQPNSRDDLWCVGYDRSLYLFDTRQCRFVSVSDVVRNKYSMKLQPRKIFALQNGHTWVVCEQGLKAALHITDSLAARPEGVELFWFDRQGIDASQVNNIVEDSAGRVWLLTDAGVIEAGGAATFAGSYDYVCQMGERVFFASAAGQLAVWQPGQDAPQTIQLPSVARINAIDTVAARQLLLATDRGLLYYDTTSAEGIAYPTPLIPAEASYIHADSKQRVWVFTATDEVVLVDAERRTRSLDVAPAKDFDGMMQGGPLWMEDRFGTIWLVPKGGNFSYYDEARGELVPCSLRSLGFENSNISCIWYYMADQQKNLWLSSTHDLSLVNFGYHTLSHVATRPNDETRSLLADSQGRLWAGTAAGYVMAFDGANRLLGYLSPEGVLTSEPVKFSTRVYALFEDSRHRLWIGTKGQGLYRVGPQGGVEHYMPNPDDDYALSHTDVYAIDEDEHGHIWVGTYENGLNLVVEQDDGKTSFLTVANTFSTYRSQDFSKIRRITHDGRGTVLLSTSGGLVTFASQFDKPEDIRFYGTTQVKSDTTSLITGDVLQAHVCSNGRIFVATMGGGMQELDASELQRDHIRLHDMHQFAPAEGNVLSMAEDGEGHLWVVRETSIDRFDMATGEVQLFGPGEMGNKVEFSEAQPVFDSVAGLMAFATIGGYLSFAPQALQADCFVPRIVFTTVRFMGESEAQPLLHRPELRVAAGKRHFSVGFAALDFRDNYRLQYAYKLEGEDDDWIYCGTNHEAVYNRLSPGSYRLLVRSTDSHGVWADNVAVLTIEVEATWWERLRWLLALLLLGAAAVLCYRKYKLKTN